MLFGADAIRYAAAREALHHVNRSQLITPCSAGCNVGVQLLSFDNHSSAALALPHLHGSTVRFVRRMRHDNAAIVEPFEA